MTKYYTYNYTQPLRLDLDHVQITSTSFSSLPQKGHKTSTFSKPLLFPLTIDLYFPLFILVLILHTKKRGSGFTTATSTQKKTQKDKVHIILDSEGTQV